MELKLGGKFVAVRTNVNNPAFPAGVGLATGEGGSWHDTNITESILSANGGSNAHNNIQPYITVYMWKRIK